MGFNSIIPTKHGVRFAQLLIQSLYSSDRGQSYQISTDKENIEIRVTPSGLLRVDRKPYKTVHGLIPFEGLGKK